jgi:hypothetical protein
MSRQFHSFGFGAVPTADSTYLAALAAFTAARALPNLSQLLASDAAFNATFTNMQAQLEIIRAGDARVVDAAGNIVAEASGYLRQWTAFLNNYLPIHTMVGIDPPSTLPSVVHPEIAAIVRGFYSRYLHRSDSQIDQAGLDFWVSVVVNDGADGLWHAEHGFRTSAIEAGLYTEATMPPPLYLHVTPVQLPPIINPNPPGSTGDGPANPPLPGTEPTNTGVVGGIENAIGGLFDKISAATNLSKRTLEIGAAVAVVAGLVYANSGGTKRR